MSKEGEIRFSDEIRLDDKFHIDIQIEKDFKSAKTKMDEELLPAIDKMRGKTLVLTGNPYIRITLEFL